MSDDDSIVAIGLLTQRDLHALGGAFDRAFPIDDVPHFEELIRLLDATDEARPPLQAEALCASGVESLTRP